MIKAAQLRSIGILVSCQRQVAVKHVGIFWTRGTTLFARSEGLGTTSVGRQTQVPPDQHRWVFRVGMGGRVSLEPVVELVAEILHEHEVEAVRHVRCLGSRLANAIGQSLGGLETQSVRPGWIEARGSGTCYPWDASSPIFFASSFQWRQRFILPPQAVGTPRGQVCGTHIRCVHCPPAQKPSNRVGGEAR